MEASKPRKELFPEQCKDDKQRHPPKAPPRSSAILPMTIAELMADFREMPELYSFIHFDYRGQGCRPKTKGMNSSAKMKDTHTSDRQLKNNPVRKVLNSQPKPKPDTSPRCTTTYTKPEVRANKKCRHVLARSGGGVRRDGICNIPQSPVGIDKPNNARITAIGKENNPYKLNINKNLASSTPEYQKRQILSPVLYTPISNSSWELGSDTSFIQREKEILESEETLYRIAEEQPTLMNIYEVSPPACTPFNEPISVLPYFSDTSFIQREKEIHENEEKFYALGLQPTLKNIYEVSPPACTPFNEPISVLPEFNNSSFMDFSTLCFDKPSSSVDNDKKEESFIVTKCDLVTKTTVNNSKKITTKLQDLFKKKKQLENRIKMDKKSLKVIVKAIKEETKYSRKNSEHSLLEQTKEIREKKTLSPEKSPIISRPKKTPIYKIQRKSLGKGKSIGLRKKIPNKCSGMKTPVNNIKGKALNMYSEMKQSLHYLRTPKANCDTRVPDTPAVISHNLQKQLD